MRYVIHPVFIDQDNNDRYTSAFIDMKVHRIELGRHSNVTTHPSSKFAKSGKMRVWVKQISKNYQKKN